MPNIEVLRAARSLGKALQDSQPMLELELAEAEMLNDLRVEQLRADLQIAEARLNLFDYESKEEHADLIKQKQSLQNELNQLPLYIKYQQARDAVENLTKRVISTVSKALKEDIIVPKLIGLPEAEQLMEVLGRPEEMINLHKMHTIILADSEIQGLLRRAMDLHERIRSRQFANFEEAKNIQSQIESIEQQLADNPVYWQYRQMRHKVDRLANTVLEILSFCMTGREHEGGCTKNQHAGPAGILACEECGKTSVPLRPTVVVD